MILTSCSSRKQEGSERKEILSMSTMWSTDCTDTDVNRDNGECEAVVIVCVHVEDPALNVLMLSLILTTSGASYAF